VSLDKDRSLLSWINRKRVRWWVALLLPALVLRSLIPLGFMPMFGPGFGVQFVVCEGYAPVPGTAPSMSMDMAAGVPMDAAMGVPGHGHSDDGIAHPDTGTQGQHDHSTCPYGTSPALGGLPTLAVVLVAIEPAAELAVALPQVAYFEISPRAQSPRGPPV
jgi:hypothetical protein